MIVYFGGNDSMHPHPSGLGAHVPLNEYVENMRKIAKHLKVIICRTVKIYRSGIMDHDIYISNFLVCNAYKSNGTNGYIFFARAFQKKLGSSF